MKKNIVIVFVLLVLFLLGMGIMGGWSRSTSRTTSRTVVRESNVIQGCVERRYQDLDKKLDRIEGKLDRLLKIAERPLPDGMQEAR